MAQLTLHQEPKQVQYFTEPLNPTLGLDMILIPGGTFQMGSPENELDRLENEGPRHTVTVPTFFMGRYPVTQAQWQVVASWKQVKQNLKAKPSHFKNNPTHPVEQVSWHDAVEFCARLSVKTGRTYRLPTEAEWEYACRDGTITPFHFGETITTDLANYRGTDWEIGGKTYPGNYGKGPKGIYRETTTPVGSLGTPNAFGLSDMHGNVWEWCQDHWHRNYDDAPEDGSPWINKNDNRSHIIRGGSWDDLPRNCRSAYRSLNTPDDRNILIGFRVVCGLPRTL